MRKIPFFCWVKKRQVKRFSLGFDNVAILFCSDYDATCHGTPYTTFSKFKAGLKNLICSGLIAFSAILTFSKIYLLFYTLQDK